MAQRRTTDYGTVILHASLVFSFAVLVATGLRVAADDPDFEWLAVLDPLLPVEEVWYYHLISGVVLMATLAGYFFYLRRAKLQSRVRFDKARFVVLLRPGRQRWAALNVIVYWVLMVSLVVEVVSGIMLFAGAGSPISRSTALPPTSALPASSRTSLCMQSPEDLRSLCELLAPARCTSHRRRRIWPSC